MNPVSLLHANIGRPLARGPLVLFPVFTSAVPAERYRTGPGAARRGTVAVDEADGGVVPELAITNRDHRPLLLLEGETILGNRQHRTLNVSVLVPAGRSLRVPVSCVEQGRWGHRQEARRATSLAPARLRRAKVATVQERFAGGATLREADQGAVWDQVAAYASRNGVRSDTGALEDVHRARAADVRHLVGGTTPLDGQRGVIAATAGRVIGMDLFDKPGTLARYWDAVVSAYALDAEAEALADWANPWSALIHETEEFLRSVLHAPGRRSPGVGEGEEIHLRGAGVVGQALVWEDAVIHLSAFPENDAVGHDGRR